MASRQYEKDPIERNLKPLRQGNSKSYGVTITDENDAAIDISGDKLYFTIKDDADKGDSDALLQISYVIPSDADAVNGKAFIPVTPADSAGVRIGTHEYDVLWVRTVSSPGDVATVQIGQIPVKRRVTHAIT